VAVAEQMAEQLRQRLNLEVDVHHRDISEADREARVEVTRERGSAPSHEPSR